VDRRIEHDFTVFVIVSGQVLPAMFNFTVQRVFWEAPYWNVCTPDSNFFVFALNFFKKILHLEVSHVCFSLIFSVQR
jgi:hypothetical protein